MGKGELDLPLPLRVSREDSPPTSGGGFESPPISSLQLGEGSPGKRGGGGSGGYPVIIDAFIYPRDTRETRDEGGVGRFFT